MMGATRSCCNRQKVRSPHLPLMETTSTLRRAIRANCFAMETQCSAKALTSRRCAMRNWRQPGDAFGGEGRVRLNYKHAAAIVISPTQRGAIGLRVTAMQMVHRLPAQKLVSFNG